MKTNHSKNGHDPYLEQKILSASPEQLIAYVYDAAISGCIKRDMDKTSSALRVLIQSLNFGEEKELQEMSTRFYKTYDYLFELLRKKKFDEVHKHLKEIRSSWVEAMKVY
jgi:flagellin-specific chaperone FliS